MRNELGTTISIHAGFPNPASDTTLKNLDLNQLLVQNSVSTFMMRVSGDDWQGQGIFDGDIALVDRALAVRKNDLVVWWRGSEFAVSYFHAMPPGAMCWGVITTVIHQYRKTSRQSS